MHDMDIYREFDVQVDLSDDQPGAGAPGPRPEEIPGQKERPDIGTSDAARLVSAALLMDMPDRILWKELDAAHVTATEALCQVPANMPIARRAVARQEALLREVQRRFEEGKYDRYKRS